MVTLCRYFFGSDGELRKIVVPANDAEVLDHTHDEPGYIGVNVGLAAFVTARADARATYAMLQPIIAQKKPLFGDLLTQRIALFDALQTLSDDRDTYGNRVAQWPSPTGPQQTLINLALANVAQDVQAIQSIRDAIAAIKAQLG